ncbi:UDP-glycosyltransferase 43-like [Cornus florida]|uniref:UDP-glycosyltransferase 43-like n=1 Tax=Cornus florida TaxID=4283 RepID=UPI00289F7D0F|nr:UDP-glycosyltransferase 43-like [Cornus florida]
MTSDSNRKVELVLLPGLGMGHLVPIVQFAQRIVDHDRRFSATILSIQVPGDSLVTAYAQSRATSSASLRFVDLPMVEPPSPDLFQTPIGFMSLFIQKLKPHVKHAITNLMSTRSESDSVILIIDTYCMTMIDVANELGIPCYLFFPSPAAFLGLMLHLPTLDQQITTEFHESGTMLEVPTFANSVHPLVLPSVLLSRTQDGYSWYLYHGRRYKETKGIILNTFQELEPFALNSFLGTHDIPPVYPVGPLVDTCGLNRPDSDQSHQDKVLKWLDHHPQSSVVFFCFGSLASISGAQVREIATGLERTGQRFLLSLRRPEAFESRDYTDPDEVLPNGFLERTAEVGLICGWVPHATILAHKAIGGLVSHCGWNSFMESLWYGVPVATWPVFGEQKMIALELVRELGLAVEMRSPAYMDGGDLVLAEEVERGVKGLMDGDGELRRKVKEINEKSRKVVMENGSSFVRMGELVEELMKANI